MSELHCVRMRRRSRHAAAPDSGSEHGAPEVSRWLPSAVNAAARTVPAIFRSPTHCRERRLTSGMQPWHRVFNSEGEPHWTADMG